MLDAQRILCQFSLVVLHGIPHPPVPESANFIIGDHYPLRHLNLKLQFKKLHFGLGLLNRFRVNFRQILVKDQPLTDL